MRKDNYKSHNYIIVLIGCGDGPLQKVNYLTFWVSCITLVGRLSNIVANLDGYLGNHLEADLKSQAINTYPLFYRIFFIILTFNTFIYIIFFYNFNLNILQTLKHLQILLIYLFIYLLIFSF